MGMLAPERFLNLSVSTNAPVNSSKLFKYQIPIEASCMKDDIDIRSIRLKLGYTQEVYAAKLAVNRITGVCWDE